MLAHPAARPDTKRPDIERAALQLFVVRDIAARAGVAEGTLYRHWRSKRELAPVLFRGCAREPSWTSIRASRPNTSSEP